MGREPKAEDLIVPRGDGRQWGNGQLLRHFHADLDQLRDPAAAPVREPLDVPQPAPLRRRARVHREPDDASGAEAGERLLHADRAAVASDVRGDSEAAAPALVHGYGADLAEHADPYTGDSAAGSGTGCRSARARGAARNGGVYGTRTRGL